MLDGCPMVSQPPFRLRCSILRSIDFVSCHKHVRSHIRLDGKTVSRFVEAANVELLRAVRRRNDNLIVVPMFGDLAKKANATLGVSLNVTCLNQAEPNRTHPNRKETEIRRFKTFRNILNVLRASICAQSVVSVFSHVD